MPLLFRRHRRPISWVVLLAVLAGVALLWRHEAGVVQDPASSGGSPTGWVVAVLLALVLLAVHMAWILALPDRQQGTPPPALGWMLLALLVVVLLLGGGSLLVWLAWVTPLPVVLVLLLALVLGGCLVASSATSSVARPRRQALCVLGIAVAVVVVMVVLVWGMVAVGSTWGGLLLLAVGGLLVVLAPVLVWVASRVNNRPEGRDTPNSDG